MRRRLLLLAAGLVCPLCLAGCGSRPADQPEVARVQGHVLRKGQPFAGVTVTFTPASEGQTNRSPSAAVTDSAGAYDLVYNRDLLGAVPGQHRVKLMKDDGLDNSQPDKPAPGEIVIPLEMSVREVDVPADGLNGGAADFDLDF